MLDNQYKYMRDHIQIMFYIIINQYNYNIVCFELSSIKK